MLSACGARGDGGGVEDARNRSVAATVATSRVIDAGPPTQTASERPAAFQVVSEEPSGEYYPCSDCHDGEDQPSNASVRSLEEDHEDLVLKHGGGRIWCLHCHPPDDRDSLPDLLGPAVAPSSSHQVCGGCHTSQHQDFVHGTHGKRLERFAGPRTLVDCISCHDPHAPAIPVRMPASPPRVREGLVRPSDGPERARSWSHRGHSPAPSDGHTR